MDATQIFELVFIEKTDEKICTLDLSGIDTKTLFELLIIITVHGLRMLFYNNAKYIDISYLDTYHIDIINTYLSKIKINMIARKLSYEEFYNSQICSYKELNITGSTTLQDLNYIVKKNTIIVIHFIKL